MKRSILLSVLTLTTVMAFTFGPMTGLVGTVPGTPHIEAATGSQQLGVITCLCVCQGPIWSIEDVRTTGSCDDLVGDPCWSFGPGTYSSCQQDGGGFPF